MLFIVHLHSHSELITNSSSELFVSRSGKTAETVRKILETLLATHNRLTESEYLFETCFQEPKEAPYSFDYEKFSEKARQEYEKYNDTLEHHYWGGVSYAESYQQSDRYLELKEKERKAAEKIGVYEKGLYDKDGAEYDRRWEEFRPVRAQIWKEWNHDATLATLQLFREFCAQNEIVFPESEVNNAKSSEWGYISLKNPAWEYFHECLGWNITVTKGDILIYSSEDNSIPYEMFDSIERYLGGDRYHLG